MKGYSPFTQYDPVKKPVGPVTGDVKAEYGKRQVWNLVEQEKAGDFDKNTEYHSIKPDSPKQKEYKSIPNLAPNLRENIHSPLKQKPKDDDSKRMTDAEHKAHVQKITEYNKKNWEKNPLSPERKKTLIKNLTESSNNARKNIDKMYDLKRTHGNLSQSDSLKLEDFKREWSDHQTMLHSLRGKNAEKKDEKSPMKLSVQLGENFSNPRGESHDTRYKKDAGYRKRHNKRQSKSKSRHDRRVERRG